MVSHHLFFHLFCGFMITIFELSHRKYKWEELFAHKTVTRNATVLSKGDIKGRGINKTPRAIVILLRTTELIFGSLGLA
jgi:hypothetical protein